MIPFVLAQALPTPAPIFASPSPTPMSERSIIESRIEETTAQARKLGGTLGVVVIDTATGVSVASNGETVLPLASLQNVAIALVAYERADRHQLALDATLRGQIARMLEGNDADAAESVTRMLGGADAINASLRDDGLDGITVAGDARGTATARALAALFTKLFQGDLLSASSRTALIAELARVQNAPDRLRAGVPPRTFVAHATGTTPDLNGVASATNDAGLVTVNGRTLVVVALLHDARGDAAARAAIIANVARAVTEATRLFPLQ